MKSKTVLITGASGGIGLKLAYQFGKDGYKIVLVARSEDKLHEIANELNNHYGVETIVIPADLSNLAAVESLIEELSAQHIKVDILVNNAGFGLFGEFYQTSWDKEKEMMMVNMVALTELTKKLIPHMLQQKSGKILNVASTAAFQPGPLMAVYFASKAYVLSFSEALQNELQDTGISVSALCPGPTETGFKNRAELEESKLFDSGVMTADAVAEIAYKGLMEGRTLIVPGPQNKVLSFMIRFLPRKTVTNIVRKVQGRKERR